MRWERREFGERIAYVTEYDRGEILRTAVSLNSTPEIPKDEMTMVIETVYPYGEN